MFSRIFEIGRLWNHGKKFFVTTRSTTVLKSETLFLQPSPKTCTIIFPSFFHHFIELWTSGVQRIQRRNIRISWIIQSSIKWRNKIVRQASRSRFKEDTPFFKIIVDLATKKIFPRFWTSLNFDNFREWKYPSYISFVTLLLLLSLLFMYVMINFFRRQFWGKRWQIKPILWQQRRQRKSDERRKSMNSRERIYVKSDDCFYISYDKYCLIFECLLRSIKFNKL